MDLFDDIVGKFFLDDRNDGVIVPLCKGDEGGSKITVWGFLAFVWNDEKPPVATLLPP